ncbi:MAG: tautomerase family protein [Promethearchaeota archaeon]
MPHIIIKMFPGRSEDVKSKMVNEIVQIIKIYTGVEDKSISIAIEEVPPDQWGKEVYKPDIIDKEKILYKKPGYGPKYL